MYYLQEVCGNLMLEKIFEFSSYGTGFDASGGFSLSDGSGFSENVTIFGAAMSSY